MVITSQTCHTLQIFFRLFPRRITTRFAVPLRKSVGVLCFLCIYTLTLSCIVKFCFATTEIEVVFYGSMYSWSMIQVIGFYVT